MPPERTGTCLACGQPRADHTELEYRMGCRRPPLRDPTAVLNSIFSKQGAVVVLEGDRSIDQSPPCICAAIAASDSPDDRCWAAIHTREPAF